MPRSARAALARPAAAARSRATLAQAQAIIDAVRAEGDAALRRCTREFDGVDARQISRSVPRNSPPRARS